MINKLEYYTGGTTSKDGCYIRWEKHPNTDDIVEKINEIIDCINKSNCGAHMDKGDI